MRAAKRLREDDDARSKAMIVFAGLLQQYPDVFGIVQKMYDGEEAIAPDAPSLVATVASRKTATLTKRAGSLRLFARWYASTGRPSCDRQRQAVQLQPAPAGDDW